MFKIKLKRLANYSFDRMIKRIQYIDHTEDISNMEFLFFLFDLVLIFLDYILIHSHLQVYDSENIHIEK